MNSTNEAPPDSVNGRIADFLASRKEAVLAEWLKRVKADPAIISTDSLNTVALRNHLPEILDDLVATFRGSGSEAAAGQAVEDAEKHGATRLRQGFELPEMMRELKLLREMLIEQQFAFEDLNPDAGLADRRLISTTLHSFLDEMGIDATEEFLWSQLSVKDRLSLGQTRC